MGVRRSFMLSASRLISGVHFSGDGCTRKHTCPIEVSGIGLRAADASHSRHNWLKAAQKGIISLLN